jgi:hypothetical protein
VWNSTCRAIAPSAAAWRRPEPINSVIFLLAIPVGSEILLPMTRIERVRTMMLSAGLLCLPLLACDQPKLIDAGTTTSQSSTVAASESSAGESESSESDDSGESTSATTSDNVPADLSEDDSCDAYVQDCPEGEKCVPSWSAEGDWDGQKCVPVLGDQMSGEPCHSWGTVESTDDCDATSYCWDVQDLDGELIGICAPFCTGPADDPNCPDLPGCTHYNCLSTNNPAPNLCVPDCQPLAQDCGPELGCVWFGDLFTCGITHNDFPVGGVCEDINDCVAGSGCVESALLPNCAGAACCTPFCDPTAMIDPCPELLADTSCFPFEEAAMYQPGCVVGRCLW